jgi:uncharacterized membrane protein YbjE (DUF340 family)
MLYIALVYSYWMLGNVCIKYSMFILAAVLGYQSINNKFLKFSKYDFIYGIHTILHRFIGGIATSTFDSSTPVWKSLKWRCMAWKVQSEFLRNIRVEET